ncbi:hydroxymethylglutaryl-CoA synthase [Virgibacillus sp. 179-BFC.A HS]|uniref:Hydroxymethylglutaryl-CoA synthase n=1 Tax=Tigheibacillus jepli TaxID=3035914 RepID=A0ABU5CL63_9BACI|nr:hydroxymethylglutaryl-CoA synthase [Virgibacillus sp. 179-BFC.A HS]MDY0407098.1 hydroxymethylglutaryl-CoA synthase [Virgibacillus sp. 179-BFC.A HS]
MNIGIDKIGCYTPHLFVDMKQLAVARDVDPGKFITGIGQEKMALAPITQDTVTLAANAALEILDEDDKEKIDLVIVGTESGIDQSKSAATYVHRLIGLKPQARTFEIKQACYGATAGIQMAKGHVALHPDRKALVIGSDIARYGLNTSGEVTQGAGAVAMLISQNPRLLAFEEHNAYATDDIMDFWRPTYSENAFVDGKFSNEQYISFFNKVWEQYKEKTQLGLADYEAICFHMPYTKMGLKALRTILDEGAEADRERLLANYEISKTYNKNIGNIYTASLYLSLLSLLENKTDLQAGARIGMYSYGSGAIGEFFSCVLQPNYRNYLYQAHHAEMFAARKEVSVTKYEEIFQEKLPTDGAAVSLNIDEDPAAIVVAGIKDHKRQYVNKTK